MNAIQKNYIFKKKNQLKDIKKILEPLLRKNTRAIQIMGGLYEEVTKEIEEAIVKVMNELTIVDQPQDNIVLETKDDTINVEQLDITLDALD